MRSDLPLLSARMKIVISLHAICMIKKLCCSHKIAKISINSSVSILKSAEIIQFNKKAWIKEYIEMNTELITEAKTDFEKDFFKLMNNAFLERQQKM